MGGAAGEGWSNKILKKNQVLEGCLTGVTGQMGSQAVGVGQEGGK